MTKTALTCLLALATLPGCGFFSAGKNHSGPHALDWVESAVVDDDAQQAIARGDYRLLIFTGRGVTVAGIPAAAEADARQRCGIKYLDGSGDVVRSDRGLQLRKLAHAYSEQYNSKVFEACKAARP